tara:strand:- start:14859 stop:16163 length:1305 start_codon:yes stop_codon:yes gene_type:complete
MSLKDTTLSIYESCLDSFKPENSVYNYLNNNTYPFHDFDKIYVVAFGKAAFSMVSGMLRFLEDNNLSEKIFGVPIVVSNSDSNCQFNIEKFISSHPTPNNISVLGANSISQYFSHAKENDLCINLISGGGSSLICSPCTGITLDDKISTNDLLLKSGANINEINTVRKHLSKIKGGRLAEIASPAKTISFIISDVINDDISSIASGPTIEDFTSFADSLEILHKYNLVKKIPSNVIKHLEDGKSGIILESPTSLTNVRNEIICSNKIFRSKLSNLSSDHNFKTFVLDRDLTKTTTLEAKYILDQTNIILEDKNLKKIAIVSGGETVVNIKGTGKGGRNQELALAFVNNLSGKLTELKWSFLSVGTDGIDGPTDSAGAIVNNESYEKHLSSTWNAQDYLDNNDSYTYLNHLNALYITGPSGNNVADIQLLLIERE